MKKYFALLISVIMILSFSLPACAVDKYEDLVFELSALGIVSADKGEDEIVTRGEFAQMAAALMGMSEAAESMGPFSPFSDVAPGAPYACAVNLLSRFGIMNGVAEGKFSPESELLSEQAVKVIAVCAGYEPLALQKGGWPQGYMSVAMTGGFLKGVNLSNPISRRDVYRILYNALDISTVDNIFGKENTYEKTGNTLRQIIMSRRDEKIFYLTGVVQANAYSYLSSPVKSLCDDEVVIDSVIYKAGNSGAAELLGHKVEFFASEKDGRYTVLSVQSVLTEETTTVKSEDFISKTGTKLLYSDEDGRQRDIEITGETKVIYNGTRVKYPDDSIFYIKGGSLSLIDYEGDGIAEVSMIDEYVSVMASSYSDGLINLFNSTRYDGKNYLYTDPEDETAKMIVTDSDGNTIESFDSDCVISIFADKSGTRYRVIVSANSVEGSINTIDEDGVTIGESYYRVDDTAVLSPMLGQEATFWINYEGKISFIREIQTENYGYILQTARKGTFGKVQAKLLEAGAVDFGVDVNEEDVNDTNKVPFLIAQNKAVSVINFADRVRFNGQSYDSDELQTALSGINLIKYELNDEGEIKKLETLTQFGGDLLRRSKYNVYEMVFGGSELFDGFSINNDTKVICVPNGVATDEDFLVKVNITVANNDVGYFVSGYEYDDSVKKAKVLLIFADMDADLVRPVDVFSTRASMVTSVRHSYDAQTGDYVPLYSILSGDSSETLKPTVISGANAVLNTLTAGDLICYQKNNNGELENAKLIRSIDKLKNDIRSVSADGYTETFGSVISREYDEVDSLNYVMVTKMTVLSGGVEHTFKIPQRNKPPVYIYDEETKTIASGKLEDIIPGNDKAYVMEQSGSNKIRAIVLVR